MRNMINKIIKILKPNLSHSNYEHAKTLGIILPYYVGGASSDRG